MIPQDKAGREYWNTSWENEPLPGGCGVEFNDLRQYADRELFDWITGWLARQGTIGVDKKLVEVGCARSRWLPVFAKQLGIAVHGIDYSPIGCEQARTMLEREHITGKIYCADIFAIPNDLVGAFDVVVSFGLIEHFSDSVAIVSALTRLLKPEGLIFTNIPNMRGIMGLAQKAMNTRIFEIHVPMTPAHVKRAHEKAGVQVLQCGYFMSSNFGVLNLGAPDRRDPVWWVKKIILAGLARVSMGIWFLERLTGMKLPVSMTFSPYVNCVGCRLTGGLE